MDPNHRTSSLSRATGPYLVLTAIYSLVHGLLLFNGNYFWDDWIWKLNPTEFNTALTELGFVFFKDTFKSFYQQSLFSAKLAIFISYLVAGLALYKALDLLQLVNRKSQFFIALFFSILPYNVVGRSTLSTFPYGITLACFLSGYLFYLQFRLKGSWAAGLLALALITLSFNTGSFLVFSIALLTLTEFTLPRARPTLPWAKLAVVVFATVTHAALFFIIKKIYFPTSGPYSAYNQVSLSFAILVKFLFSGAPTHFFEPMVFSFFGKDLQQELQSHLRPFLYFVFMIGPALAALIKKRKPLLILALAGIGLIYAADFPYMIVGKSPDSFSWNARHQLLLPLGAALWLASILSFWEGRKREVAAVICAIAFGVGTIRLYLGVQGLAYRDQIFQAKLPEMIDKDASHSYFVEYRSAAPALLQSDWNFYELTGMLYSLLGHQKNSIVMTHQASIFKRTDIDFFSPTLRKRYMLSEAHLVNPGTCLIVSEKTPMHEGKVLSLLMTDLTQGRERLMRHLDEMYTFTRSTVDSSDLTSIRCP